MSDLARGSGQPPSGRDRLDDDSAELLLDGWEGGPPALVNLLRAATGPGSAAELAGEAGALALFRSARATAPPAVAVPVTGARTAVARRWDWRRLVTAKVVGVAATLVLGGVAVAAGVGAIPNPLPRRDSGERTVGSYSPTPRGSGPASTTTATTTPGQEEVADLCRSFLAEYATAGEAATRDPRYQQVADLAGGREHLHRYCTVASSPSTKPTPPGHVRHVPGAHARPEPTHPQPTPHSHNS